MKHADKSMVLTSRKCWRFSAETASVLLALAVVPVLGHGQNAPAPEKQASAKQDAARQATTKPDTAVRTQMHNVKFRFADNVAVYIKSLSGALVPAGDHEFPVLDDKNSFRIRIDNAEIAIAPADLSNALNSYAFARPGSPVGGISIVIVNGQLKVKGKLRDKGNIPFESTGTLTPTSDGRVRLHAEKIRALHVPVKGLMDTFGVELDDLIKTGKIPGVDAEENDLILDLSQIMPPPHIDGKVMAIRVEGSNLVQTFGTDVKKTAAKPLNLNYMSYQGNKLAFGKLTMTDTDIVLNDLDPSDPLDFYLDHYKDQLAAGYTKISTNFQLRAFLKDFDKLGKTKAPAINKNPGESGTP